MKDDYRYLRRKDDPTKYLRGGCVEEGALMREVDPSLYEEVEGYPPTEMTREPRQVEDPRLEALLALLNEFKAKPELLVHFKKLEALKNGG